MMRNAEDLARALAADLQDRFSARLPQFTDKAIKGDLAQARDTARSLGIDDIAAACSIAQLIWDVSTFVWENYKTSRSQADLIAKTLDKVADANEISKEDRQKVVTAAVTRLHEEKPPLPAGVEAKHGTGPGGSGRHGRVALVIGNSAYEHVPRLRNPVNDARKVSAALRRLGFRVTLAEDLDLKSLNMALEAFAPAAHRAAIAVLYFAGHGMEVNGRNYLVPVDARLGHVNAVRFQTVAVQDVVEAIDGPGDLRLAILDACRDNPFLMRMENPGGSRSLGRGLARIEPGGNIVVAYSAKHGTIARDGSHDNSPYALALLEHIETPGLEIRRLFARVRDSVRKATDGAQEPHEYQSLGDRDIFLKPVEPDARAAESGSGQAAQVFPAMQADPRLLEAMYWRQIENSTDPDDFEDFLAKFPDGSFERLARKRLKELEAQSSKPQNFMSNLKPSGLEMSQASSFFVNNTKGSFATQTGTASWFNLFFQFKGRTSRSQYWLGIGFLIIAFIPVLILINIAFNKADRIIAEFLFELPFLWPTAALLIKRLHDLGYGAKAVIPYFVIEFLGSAANIEGIDELAVFPAFIQFIFVVLLGCFKGSEARNAHGESPLQRRQRFS